jgi:hypothetical protein
MKMKTKLNKVKLMVGIVATIAAAGAINVNAQFAGFAGSGFGFSLGYFPVQDRSLGRVSLAADINYDGYLDVGDRDNRPELKRNPPGLIVGARELARVDLAVEHNTALQTNGSPELKFMYYKTAVILDLRPVNLGHRRGKFKTFADEQARSGRMLVWLDPDRKTLLLDSSDPERRRVQWPAATSLPPKHVYVEGVACGDSGTVMMLTLLLDNNNMTPTVDKIFGDKACWDAMMFSVWPSPRAKPYVDSPVVWKRL